MNQMKKKYVENANNDIDNNSEQFNQINSDKLDIVTGDVILEHVYLLVMTTKIRIRRKIKMKNGLELN